MKEPLTEIFYQSWHLMVQWFQRVSKICKIYLLTTMPIVLILSGIAGTGRIAD